MDTIRLLRKLQRHDDAVQLAVGLLASALLILGAVAGAQGYFRVFALSFLGATCVGWMWLFWRAAGERDWSKRHLRQNVGLFLLGLTSMPLLLVMLDAPFRVQVAIAGAGMVVMIVALVLHLRLRSRLGLR